MVLNLLPRQPEAFEKGQVAFLTPKRLGPAVIRNRMRRRMREIYRRHLGSFTDTSYWIWIARPPCLELDFGELKKCMIALKERAVAAK